MPGPSRSRLVALSAPSRRLLAEAIVGGWGKDALLPLDPALPEAERARILHAARLGAQRSPDGETEIGREVAVGTQLVVPTAGSTGQPKLVELSRSTLEAAASASNRRLDAGPDDGWLCCLPLSHIAGLGIVVRTLVSGSELIVHDAFDPHEVASCDAAFTSVVPTMLVRLLDAGVDLARFKAILVGGAHVPPGLLERARACGAHVVTTYGMTESCGGVIYDGFPLEGVSVELEDDGRIRLAGATLMTGYLGDPVATESVLRDGWFRTSDSGELDSRGALQVVGRIDDVIITGGENVYPTEVEGLLETHEAVAEALVTSLPDDRWGERVVAFVILRSPAGEDELKDHVASRAARHKVPKEISFVDDLPRLPSGKLRRARAVAKEDEV
jgi:O-succinylbenzoic acid--CoA ligase